MQDQPAIHSRNKKATPYLTASGAWALAFGCAVGWGAFVMPGTTFLPVAGPVGTAIGIGVGAAVMLVLAANYHYLMNRFSGGGGVYTYTKRTFGSDHGFISAWFLILTYIAILWANATALPLIARTLLGSTFQFGFNYEIAGFHVYFGEILLAVGSLTAAALLCLRRKLAERTQIVMAVLLFGGVVACFAAACGKGGAAGFDPPYAPGTRPAEGVYTIFALAPWAFVGFESISHSAAEARFPLKRSFRILAAAVVAAGIAYALLTLLAVTALPQGCASWTDYIANLGSYSGVASQPTFHAAHAALGGAGSVILGTAALCGIFTGLIGNYIALSRLLRSMAEDHMLPGAFGETDRHEVPRKAILCILLVSVGLPFLGRTAISWIVDVTTVGATIAYAFASASAWKCAKGDGDRKHRIIGLVGIIVSLLFALVFLIPNITSVKTLATESYLILAAWSILGFLFFRFVLKQDTKRRFGRSTVAWMVLLGLIIFTSSVWMRQATKSSIENSVTPIHTYYTGKLEEAGVDIVTSATRDSRSYLTDALGKIGNTFDVSIIIQIVLIVGALLVLFDISKQTQKRERQIEIEKALAEDANRAKTSFLSNMSHEIRTPMNAIIGLDNIALRNPDLQPETRDQLEKIGASARHLLGLINDILDMSRIESGRMVLKDEEFSFREFMDQINVIAGGQCADKGLQYDSRTGDDVADYYCGDDMKLKQVLINILGNSVKFTPAPGQVSLSVRETARVGGTASLRFTIRDTGIGMDKEYIPKLFDAFTQEDATKTSSYGGSGLGMAITKNYVDMMQGEIHVESEKGAGSVFTVTVPLRVSERKEAPKAEAALPEAGSLAGRRVLIAEDVEQNAEILANLLELEEITSEHAENGEIAVRMFAGHPAGYYDAILMDIRMPVMDGLTAVRAIRALDRPDAAAIPVIAMTADVFDEDIQNSLAAGMNAHLFKPVEPNRLMATLKELVCRDE